MKNRTLSLLLALGLLLFLSSCRPYHPTPFDALTEWPGRLDGADSAVLESIQVLKEEEVAGGLVILYTIPSKESGENVLVSTFVTPEGSGWRAQSSGWKDYSNSDDFVFGGIAGGNITDLTTVSGISNKGETVRIEWSDGQIDTTPIESGSFLFSRPETLAIRRVELLDGSGSVLESKEFETAAAEATTDPPGPRETPGEILMAEPTASPDSPTRIPVIDKTGFPPIDHVIETILSNDLNVRQALVRFVSAGCTTADGLGSIPKCEDGQAEGTAVEFLPLGGPGEGSFVLASEVANVLDFEAEVLYAAYAVSQELPGEPAYPHGTYALFFITAGGAETVVLRVDGEGHIVRLDNLGMFPVDTYFQQKTAGLIDPPPQTEMFAAEAAEILVYPPGMPPQVATFSPSLKGYTLHSDNRDGQWYFTLAPGLNAAQPCATPDSTISENLPDQTLKGIDSLKAALDQLQPGEYVVWCSAGLPDAGVIDEIMAYGVQKGLNLTPPSDLKPSPTVTSSPAAIEPPSLPAPAPETGIAEVDRAVAAVLSNDIEARRELVRLTTSGCTHEPGMGGPPKCEPGQEEGAPVEHFPILGPGEGEHIEPEEIDRILDFHAEALYVAYRGTGQEALDPSFPTGGFGLVFTMGETGNIVEYILVHINEDGNIVRLDFMAGEFDPYLEKEVGEWLVAPPQTRTP